MLCLLLALSLAACGGEDKSDNPGTSGKPSDGGTATTSFLQPDPGKALTVVEAREMADGDEVVVEGRVQNINKGYAMFTMYDPDLLYCGQPGTAEAGREPMDGCLTPWDYCCSDPDEVAAGNIPVEMRDAKGAPVKADDIGLRLLDLVRVKGKLEKTESGNFILVATSGWFRAERPEIGDHVHWPE
jgi:hypothetical protein